MEQSRVLGKHISYYNYAWTILVFHYNTKEFIYNEVMDSATYILFCWDEGQNFSRFSWQCTKNKITIGTEYDVKSYNEMLGIRDLNASVISYWEHIVTIAVS